MSWSEDGVLGWSGSLPGGSTGDQPLPEKQGKYIESLDGCRNFAEVFQLVKKSVKDAIKLERRGMMLFLADLPYVVGAYHQVGTNNIVMNRMLLDHVLDTAEATREANSFIYSILTHEYLHALGYLDEREARDMTYRVSRDTFGDGHLATRMAASTPWQYIKPIPFGSPAAPRPPSVVRDFELPPFGYIS